MEKGRGMWSIFALVVFLLHGDVFVFAAIQPPVCNYANQQSQSNFSLCNGDVTASWCTNNLPASQIVPFDDPVFPCVSPLAHCVEPPPTSFSAGSPFCLGDRGCTYSHAVPFELMTFSPILANMTPPMQYLGIYTSEGFSITDMFTERTVYYDLYVPFSWIPQLRSKVVSPSNFVNTAYIVFAYENQVRVYTASLYDSLSISVCTVDVPNLYPIYKMDTMFDQRTNATWMLLYSRSNELQFIPINSTGCPDLRYIQKWSLSSADGSVNFSNPINVSFVNQITPDHTADVENGCFPPLASRTLISINTEFLVFIFGFAPTVGKNTSVSVALTANSLNEVFDVRYMPRASIFYAEVFGECFGNINAPSQMLWLALSIQTYSANRTISSSSLQLISLNEFSLHPLSCDLTDPAWWQRPASKRVGCATVSKVCTGYNKYPQSNTACLDRTIQNSPLNDTIQAPISIFHRMQTGSYDDSNSVAPSSARFVHLLFLYSPSNRTLSIYGMQEEACVTTDTSSLVIVEQLNSFPMAHAAQHIDVTENGQHVFVSLILGEWEIEAHMRLLNICAILTTNSSLDSVLLQYNSTCIDLQPEPMNSFSYLEYYSQCSGGERCWRYGNYEITSREDLGNTIIQYPLPSYFALRPTIEFTCDQGFYCPGDSSARVICPSGYHCPDLGLDTPVKCPPNPHYDTTCRYTGLATPVPCPDGMVCLSPSSAPVPAPPGFFVMQHNRDYLFSCQNGSWCALQQFSDSNEGISNDMSCLSGASCSDPSVLAPAPCHVGNYTEYCPPGTVTPSLCPAGNYCATPQEVTPCLATYYCPAGSQQANLCPEGYYCPTPSEKVRCPSKHFCRTGFTAPQECHPLVYCPEGSKSEKFAWSGLIFDLGVIVVLGIMFWIWVRIRNWCFRNKKPRSSTARKNRSLQLRPKKFRVEFGFQDLTLEINGSDGKPKKILNGVTGSIKPGRITAIMGPSGAGKTTFLTTLASKDTKGTLSGSLNINGAPDNIARYKKIVGFVPQEDIMHRELTVKENILFNAEVRLPVRMSKDNKRAMVNDVIDILGLYDVRHERIGDETTRGVSGGQRKRVNIAMELVADPTVLFLDEPTSGLDSTSSEEVVRCLKKVADLGLTIVVVLHQPRYEIFQLFDDVLLLAKGGRTVYLGPSVRALDYFRDVGFACPQLTNPPDFFMDVISGTVRSPVHPQLVEEKQISDYLCSCWSQINAKGIGYIPSDNRYLDGAEDDDDDEESQSLLPAVARRRTAGFFSQLKLFFVRGLVQLTREFNSFLLDNALVLIAGSVLGALYVSAPYRGPLAPALIQMCPAFMQDKCELPQSDQLNAMAMLISLSTGFTAITASLKCFGPERVVFWREASAGINIPAYFIGKNIAQFFNIGLAPVVFLSVFYALTSPRATFLTYYTILVLLQFCFVGFGYLVSVIFSYKNSQLAGVVLTLIFGMFGGTNPSLKQLHENIVTTVVSSLSPNRWAQEALYVSEITRYENIYSIDSSLQFWGFNKDHYKLDLIMLVVLGLCSRILALILLRRLNRDKMQ